MSKNRNSMISEILREEIAKELGVYEQVKKRWWMAECFI